jgi:hypothetical protein
MSLKSCVLKHRDRLTQPEKEDLKHAVEVHMAQGMERQKAEEQAILDKLEELQGVRDNVVSAIVTEFKAKMPGKYAKAEQAISAKNASPEETAQNEGLGVGNGATASREAKEVGSIDAALSKKIGRQAGKIKLDDGNSSYGRQHIEQRHGKQLENLGYTVDGFVAEVGKDFNAVYRAPAGQLVLAKRNGKDHIMFVQLSPSENGDYYRVNSAFPVEKRTVENKLKHDKFELLWEGIEPHSEHIGDAPAFAHPSDNKADSEEPSVQRHSDASIEQGSPNNQSDSEAKKTEENPQGDLSAPEILTTKGTKLADKATETITDFGEKLEGAKKDTRSLREKLSDKNVDTAAVPLSQSFPQPDYEKLAAAGVPHEALAFVAMLRGEIKAKPKRNVRGWADTVNALRSYANNLLDGSLSIADAVNEFRVRGSYAKNIPDVIAIAKEILPSQIKDLGAYRLEHRHYSIYRGKENVFKWTTINTAEKGGAFRSDGVETNFDTKEEALVFIKSQVSTSDEAGKPLAKFDMWSIRGEEGYWVGKKLGTNKYIELKKFGSSRDARDYIVSHNDELTELLKQKKHIGAERRAEQNERVGKDYRRGVNVTQDLFDETFGFRGVQFGTYVNNDKRQQDLNNAYDGLLDLAEVLGIPPKAISLNGELGLAFGARGNGGKDAASAHYESSEVVINLTKANGAGSLAHEWWHALDNYFAKKGELKSKSGEFLTELNRPQHKEIMRDGRRTIVEADPRDFGVRPEVYDAFKAVVSTIKKDTKLYERSAVLDNRKTADYWTTTRELTARAFERYVIDELKAKGYESDYLASILPKGAWDASEALFGNSNESYPYPTDEEAVKINAAYSALFDAIETKETDRGVALYSLAADSDSFKPQDSERFSADLAASLASLKSIVPPIRIGKTPAVLKALGAPDLDLYIRRDTVRKATNGAKEDHDVPMDVIERLPTLLADPVAVLDSSSPTIGGEQKALVIMVEAKTKEGKPVVVALHLEAKEGRLEINRVASVYGRTGFSAMKLRYLSPQKSPDLVRLVRVQFPLSGSPNQGSGLRVLGPDDIVKGENKYSLADKNTGTISHDEVTATLARVRAGFDKGAELPIVPLASFAEFPAAIQADAKERDIDTSKIKGVFHKGKILVNLDALKTSQELESVILHELAHDGLAKMFGPEITSAMSKLYFAIGGAKALDDLAAKYAMPVDKYSEAYKDSGTQKRTAIMMEEALAHIAQDSRPNVKRRLAELVGAIRQWLRAHGFLATSKVSESELFAILREARKASVQGDGDARYSLADGEGQNPSEKNTFDAEQNRTQFSRYSQLGRGRVDIAQTVSDVSALLGFDIPFNIGMTADMPSTTPMRFNLNNGVIEVNSRLKLPRDEAAQYLIEEVLHGIDVLGPNRTLSSVSNLLHEDGAVYREALDHFTEGGLLSEFLAYPLDRERFGMYSDDRVKAELFARLGVVYLGEPALLKEALPHAYDTFHRIFGLERESPVGDAHVFRKVWKPAAGQRAEILRRYRPDKSPRLDAYTASTRGAAGRGLGGLRRAISGALQGSPFGGRVSLKDKGLNVLTTRPSGGFSVSGDGVSENTGEFSQDNADIRYSLGGDLREAFKTEARKQREAEAGQLDPLTRAAYNRLGDSDKGVIQRIKTQIKRQLTPAGLLPKDVFNLKIERDGLINSDEFLAGARLSGLYAAVKKEFGRPYEQLQPRTKALLDRELKGEDMRLPPAVKHELVLMRDQVKRLSATHLEQLIADAGRLSSEGRDQEAAVKLALADTIANNMETYLHRSYRAFDDKDWPAKVPPKVFDAAVKYLAQGYAGDEQVTADHIAAARKKATLMLEEGTAFDTMGAFISESKLGAKDLSIIKKRKDIAPEIRALLGEYEDPTINFAKTVTKMGRLVYNHAFLGRVRDIGFEQGFLHEAENLNLHANKQIAGDASEVYAPLNGLYTTKEFHQAMVDAMGREEMAGWYRLIVQANGMVKFGKTVLSPTTAIRNLMSAMFFSLANGHFNFGKGKRFSFSAYFRRQGDGVEYMAKLRKLGVVYDAIYAAEMMDLLKDSRLEDTIFASKPMRWTKNGLEYAQKFYSFGDDLWKIIGFENEKAMLMKNAGMSEAAAEKEAAERIRNTYPTYSMTPRAVNALRRFPLVGTFVSFPAEIIRTSYHITRYLAHDIKTQGLTSPMVWRKLAGWMIAAGAMYGLQALTQSLFGVSDDEEDALRLLSPPWQKNSNLMFLGRDEKGALRTMDMSFLDPYGYWKRPINALMQGLPLGKALKSGAHDLLVPFFGQDIAFGAIMDVAMNKKDTGGPVFNPEDGAGSQTLDISLHLAKAIQPGIASNIGRFYMASQGRVSASGKKYSAADEAAALAGFRWGTFEPRTALYYQSFGFMDRKRNAAKVLSSVVRDPNEVSDDDLKDAFEQSMRSRDAAYGDMIKIAAAAKAGGLSVLEVQRTLIDSGIGRDDARDIARGKIPKLEHGHAASKGAIKKAALIFGRDTADEIKRRDKFISKLTANGAVVDY